MSEMPAENDARVFRIARRKASEQPEDVPPLKRLDQVDVRLPGMGGSQEDMVTKLETISIHKCRPILGKILPCQNPAAAEEL